MFGGVRAFLLAITWLMPAGAEVFTVLNAGSLAVPAASERFEILLKAETPNGTSVTAPVTVEDLSTSSLVGLKKSGDPAYVGGSGQRGFWRMAWQVSGLAAGASESRAILVKQGAVAEVLPITFMRKPAPDVQATVNGPASPLRLSQSRSTGFRIVLHGPVSHVQPTLSTLIDEKSGQVLPRDQIELTDTPNAPAPNSGLTLQGIRTVYLRVKPGFDKPGKYSGVVTLSAAEKPDLGSFPLTVYSTNAGSRAIGIFLIASGLLIYFLMAVRAKNRAKRIQAELPAARLREEVQRLLSTTRSVQQRTRYVFPSLLAAPPAPGSLHTLDAQLAESNLDAKGFLPSKWTSAFGATDLSIQYQSFLQVASNQINALSMIVSWGIATVEKTWPEVVRLNLQAAGNSALVALDGFATFSGTPDMLRGQIQATLSALQSAISRSGALGGASLVVQGTATPRELTIQLEQLSGEVWVIWALLTIFTGACVLVFFNSGFGTPQDLIQCFLWGVGVPSVAQGFGALNANAITSSISLPVAR